MLFSEFIAQRGLAFEAELVEFNAIETTGQTTVHAWPHDRWVVKFTAAHGVSFSTTYKTGTGHRRDISRAYASFGHEWSNAGEVIRYNKAPGGKAWNLKGRLYAATEPLAADVLCSLASDSRAIEQTFEEWCSDYGSDTDSIRARAVYDACCTIAMELIRLLGLTGLAELQACEEG